MLTRTKATGHSLVWISALVSIALLAPLIGCGKKKPPATPPQGQKPPPGQKAETEADREAKRQKAAHAIIAEGSTCLPDDPLELKLAAVGEELLLCAYDNEPARALGPVACWTLDRKTNGLVYRDMAPLPGHGFQAKVQAGCARGYCPPDKLAPDTNVYLAPSTDGLKLGMLSGDLLHIFDAGTKSFEKTVALTGESLADKALTGSALGLNFISDVAFVTTMIDTSTIAVYGFRTDGTALGAIASPTPRDKGPVSAYLGSITVLDSDHLGIAGAGLSSLVTYEVSSGKRAKLMRKPPKLGCKPAELAAFWKGDPSSISAKCQASLDTTVAPLIGADLLRGKKAILASLRGARKFELAILDLKTLAEKGTIKLPQCSAPAAAPTDAAPVATP